MPWALATPDGLLAKTEKAKLLHKLEDGTGYEDIMQLEDNVYIMDGNALLQALTGLPQTFGELTEKVFCSLPEAKTVHFVTDTYKEDSIKPIERKRPTQSFLVKGPSARLPRDWKAFLQNKVNKESLIRFSSMYRKNTAMRREYNIVKFCLFVKTYVYACKF